jgi:hypothetical protein
VGAGLVTIKEFTPDLLLRLQTKIAADEGGKAKAEKYVILTLTPQPHL